jgi:hypothetical protein
MSVKKFSEATDKELWADLRAAEYGPAFDREEQRLERQYKGTPLNQFLRRLTSDAWCCKAVKETSRHIQFRDGTRMGVHFCPRCGREL